MQGLETSRSTRHWKHEVSTFFDGKDQTWHVVIRILDSWWEIVLDDLQLKKLETKTSNG